MLIAGLGAGGSFVLEARFLGSRNSRTNNLGDVGSSRSGRAYESSAIGTFTAAGWTTNIYRSIAVGNQALSERLSAFGGATLEAELMAYGPKGGKAAYAADVLKLAGLSSLSGKSFNSLSSAEKNAVIQALKNKEGKTPSDVSCATVSLHG